MNLNKLSTDRLLRMYRRERKNVLCMTPEDWEAAEAYDENPTALRDEIKSILKDRENISHESKSKRDTRKDRRVSANLGKRRRKSRAIG